MGQSESGAGIALRSLHFCRVHGSLLTNWDAGGVAVDAILAFSDRLTDEQDSSPR
jgi:hypothetical protein